LRIHVVVRIVDRVQRSLARKLIALLLLLALVAGEDHFAAMAMDMDDAHMSDMQKPDMSCKGCDRAMTAAPCDAVCAALPAIETASLELPASGFHERWMMRSDASATFSIKPDTSPPRA
jgi:hypothetical protein